MRKSNVILIDRNWVDNDRTKPSANTVQKFVALESVELVKDCPRFMSVNYLAAMFECTQSLIYDWIKHEGLQAQDIGTGKRPTYRVYRDHLAAFLAQRAG